MKKFKSILIMLFFLFSPLLSMGFVDDCNVNGPGGCLSRCIDGSLCCVGTTANCSTGLSNGKQWINCGEGQMTCLTDGRDNNE